MKKNTRKGIALIIFAVLLILARYFLAPENEVLRYIAKYVGAFIAGLGTSFIVHHEEDDEQREYAIRTGKCPMCPDCPDGCPLENPRDSKNHR